MLTDLSHRTTSRRKLPNQAKVRSTFQRRAYLLNFRPSWVAGFFLLLLCGQIKSILRFFRFSRSGSESAALSYISRFTFVFPYAISNKGSINLTSAGEAEVTVLPRGTPSPSTTTIHFEPLPRLVFPTSRPLFLPTRNYHQQRPLPNSIKTVCLTLGEIFSRLLTRPLLLPNTVTAANKCLVMGSRKASPSIWHRIARPIGYLQNKPDFRWALDRLFLFLPAVDMALSFSIVRLLAQMKIDSYSSFLLVKKVRRIQYFKL